MSRVVPSFTIEIDRVFLHKQVHGQPYPVEKEFIRGDLVLGIRPWHKSDKDKEMIEGEMCEVTVRDPANVNLRAPHQKYQVAEAAKDFNDRLNQSIRTAERELRDPAGHPVTEPRG